MLLLLAILWILCDAGGGQQHQQQQQQQQRARFTPVHRFPPPPIVPVPGGGVKISPELINQALQLPPNYQGQGSGFAPQRMTQLTISQGALRGRMSSTPSGKGMVAFMGVPYAAAPIGPLRFKPPVGHPGWSSVLDSTAFRSACPQFDYRGRIVGNEDCLFLNVFTPGVRPGQQQPSYPVMVFVHGGNFESGAASQYGPERLVDKDVVVVTINYRIGILGFLSTGDNVCPGNLGLLDQNLALKWVRDNVGHFGGDPGRVTLFGQGSGAVSVFLHILSPLSQGLFQRAIAESGSPLSDWSIEPKPTQFKATVAEGSGCKGDGTSYAFIECLSQTPTSELLRIQQESKMFGDFPIRTAPVVETFNPQGAFLPEDPMTLLDRGDFRRLPLIAGINKDETAFFYPFLSGYMRQQAARSPSYVRNMLLPQFFSSALRYDRPSPDVLDSVDDFYFKYINPLDTNNMIRAFINMSTDAMFVSGNHATLTRYSRHEPATHMYVFEYRGDSSLLDARLGFQRQPFDLGVSNGDELIYLFQVTADGLRPLSNLDYLVSNRIVNLWTDFAKSGEAPQFSNFEYPRWPRVTPSNVSTYVIGRALIPAPEYKPEASRFWASVSPAQMGWRDSSTMSGALVTTSGYVEPLYRTLSWAMVAVAIALAIVVVVLLVVLYNQKKSQSFRASSDFDNSRMSGSTLY
ncbi:cocaine esterase [Ixodes scapularis]|uniref:cocaine esterase n=1 Tax=Ixodes scapularis TaxID=6945 RepID=UPI001C38E3B6|nr:cocaine esterase [Ixodes scapularis]